MRKKCKDVTEAALVPFPTITAASAGDIVAINTILKHYEGYIKSLSTRKLCDEYGNTHYCVDEALCRRLETKLITKILDFKPIPYGAGK